MKISQITKTHLAIKRLCNSMLLDFPGIGEYGLLNYSSTLVSCKAKPDLALDVSQRREKEKIDHLPKSSNKEEEPWNEFA